jgi:hypothetical protein
MPDTTIAIPSAAQTPLGRFQGDLSSFNAHQFGGAC